MLLVHLLRDPTSFNVGSSNSGYFKESTIVSIENPNACKNKVTGTLRRLSMCAKTTPCLLVSKRNHDP